MRWARRLEGTVKHLPVCGGGRLYTHTAEGQVIAVEVDSRECLGAIVSNGRIFYMSQASGFVVSQTYGEDSKKLPAVWER